MARGMRKEPTPAEAIVWEALRRKALNGLKFRRQHAVEGYIVDFYCHEKMLCIELDGAPHLTPAGKERDDFRDSQLQAKGLTVLRFSNDEALRDFESFKQRIIATAEAIKL
jgi:very-short-patch-repair endonuclease